MGNPEGTRDSSARIQITVALIGLLGVVATALISNWNNIFPKSNSAPTPTSSSSAPTAKKPERAAHSSGQLVVRGTWHCDLDTGAETNTAGDFWWEQETDVKRFLTPESGAAFFVVGIRDFDSLRFAELEHFQYSAQRIEADDAPANNLPRGTVVAYRTKQGRLGKFRVADYGRNMTIRWITYDK